jgi:hypothetical protein
MTKGISGVLAAGVVLAALAAQAAAEPPPTSSPNAIVVAQASPDGSTATRPSRKRAETRSRSKKEPTAGQMVARERQKKCAAEWKSAKADGKVESGMKWPKFWSACNARLKGNSA